MASRPLFLRVCALTVPCAEDLQRGYDVENPPASERRAADRCYDVRDSVRDGIRLDGKWKHQRVREDASGCKPVRPGKPFIQSITVFTLGLLTIGQLIQLGDVASGLIYIHSQEMIHGDLKGVRF